MESSVDSHLVSIELIIFISRTIFYNTFAQTKTTDHSQISYVLQSVAPINKLLALLACLQVHYTFNVKVWEPKHSCLCPFRQGGHNEVK